VTWNPESEDSPVRKRLLEEKPTNLKITKLNYQDNPWFPDVLEQERLDCLRIQPELYSHVWEGELLTRHAAQVLADKWYVEPFSPSESWNGPYHGADWGFSNDPTTAVRCWINDNVLYIEHESYQKKLSLDKTRDRWCRDIPGIEDYVIYADNARPESIHHVKGLGLPRLQAVRKWPGSVEDGVAYLRSFSKIVIHPRCTNTIKEAQLWKYKEDSKTGDILPKLAPGNDHTWDAIRYALEPIIRRLGKAKRSGYKFA
jgi:phage terminase large subunit